jgi:putative oxidoreductase
MRIVSIVARVLFGLAFTAAGLSGFVIFFTSGPPAMPGLAGEFQAAIFRSHFVLFVDAVQAVTGVLLLVNRFVPLALVTTAAVLANILAFHIAMMPLGIFPGLILTVCWVLVALPLRANLAPLLAARTTVSSENALNLDRVSAVGSR